MSVTDISNIFSQFSGLSLQETLKYNFLINMAIIQVEQRLLDVSYINSHRDLLNHICAAIAFYQYALIINKNQLEGSFKAGDVSISTKNDKMLTGAKILKDDLLAMGSDILIDNDFIFRQV